MASPITATGTQGRCTKAAEAVAGQQRADRPHLKAGLPLRQPGDRQAHADASQVFAQAADQNLAQHDHDRGIQSQGTEAPVADQHHQRRRHQQLVGDRVQHAAKTGCLAALTRQLAVEVVGDGGRAEHDAGQKVGHRQMHRDQHHHQGDRGDAREGQQVRQLGQHWLDSIGRNPPQVTPLGRSFRRLVSGGVIQPDPGVKMRVHHPGDLPGNARHGLQVVETGLADPPGGAEMVQQGTLAAWADAGNLVELAGGKRPGAGRAMGR